MYKQILSGQPIGMFCFTVVCTSFHVNICTV